MRDHLDTIWIATVYYFENAAIRVQYEIDKNPLGFKILSSLAAIVAVGLLLWAIYSPTLKPSTTYEVTQPHSNNQQEADPPSPQVSASSGVETQPTPQKQTSPPETTAPATTSARECDPNYTPCVPLVNYDLDCGDIGYMVWVTGSDPHRFDRDRDGLGCESYR